MRKPEGSCAGNSMRSSVSQMCIRDRSMAADGCDSDSILGFFYEGSGVKTVY